ncbi:hypothetical protein [Tolypothrix sp. VBCCA 56010]|uniref:hypothetical protein n=1 Tax=Tolypothrix sp. VBCCA 56010 TaxID=3137731 RepID=UPI003D7DE85A
MSEAKAQIKVRKQGVLQQIYQKAALLLFLACLFSFFDCDENKSQVIKQFFTKYTYIKIN